MDMGEGIWEAEVEEEEGVGGVEGGEVLIGVVWAAGGTQWVFSGLWTGTKD